MILLGGYSKFLFEHITLNSSKDFDICDFSFNNLLENIINSKVKIRI